MEIKIIRSRRRRRTVSARMIKDMMLIHAPAIMPEAHLEKIIANFRTRFKRKMLKDELNKKEDLASIAKTLNEKYFLGKLDIKKIEYVTDQNSKFGCCNYRLGNIRISHRLSKMPHWVRDYVILHELTHLIEPNHSKSFWDIVSRYKLTERARGYLIAVGLGEDGEEE